MSDNPNASYFEILFGPYFFLASQLTFQILFGKCFSEYYLKIIDF